MLLNNSKYFPSRQVMHCGLGKTSLFSRLTLGIYIEYLFQSPHSSIFKQLHAAYIVSLHMHTFITERLLNSSRYAFNATRNIAFANFNWYDRAKNETFLHNRFLRLSQKYSLIPKSLLIIPHSTEEGEQDSALSQESHTILSRRSSTSTVQEIPDDADTSSNEQDIRDEKQESASTNEAEE